MRVLFLHVFCLILGQEYWYMDIQHNTANTNFQCGISQRLRIYAHCSLWYIRLFGINMTPMWHHCIFICFIYVMWFFTRSSALSIETFIFVFFQISITLGYQWWIYTFSRNAKFTTTHDLVTCIYLLWLWWQQLTQFIITYNNNIIFVPSIFETTIIGIT